MIQKYQEEKAMLYFDSDYMEGAHPAILQRLMETNMSIPTAMERMPIANLQKQKSAQHASARRRKFIFWSAGPKQMRP